MEGMRKNDSRTIASTPKRRRRLDQEVFKGRMLKYSPTLGEEGKDDDEEDGDGDTRDISFANANNATTTDSSLVNLITMKRATTTATASISTSSTATTTTSTTRTERWRIGGTSSPTRKASGKNKYKVLARSVRTALTGSEGTRKRLESGLEFRRMLIKSAPAGEVAVGVGDPDPVGEVQESDGGMSSPLNSNYNYPADADIADISAGVSKRLLDIHQISTRLHRSFPWEGLGLHNGSRGNSFITSRIGFSPATAPHTIVFSSFYIVPLILLLGVVVGFIWLFCACFYHTMKKIKFALCPGRSRSEDGGTGKKGKKSWGRSKGNNGNNSNSLEEKKPAILTPEMLEMRRQERLTFLQEECANLEQQLTGLRASLPPQQSSFEEKSATLTSRASDSDLEYLAASEESPPLKRNSISLQDIPQSVLRIRREKQLRQIKEEIEYLRSIAQQEKDKAELFAKSMKGSLLLIQDFELPPSKPGSPGESKVEPLSQHKTHLKTQRKLTEIRGELEDLAIQLLHADEIKAKRNSLQDLPRTAINIKREQNIITMTNEIQKMRNYKLQKICVIETALEKTNSSPKKGGNPGKSGGKSFNNSTNGNPSKSEDSATKHSNPEFNNRSSIIRRQREQELNRVRVELKDLAYKLNLNPMNYISEGTEDRVRLVPSQSMQSTTSASAAGQSCSYNKSTSSSSALNHV